MKKRTIGRIGKGRRKEEDYISKLPDDILVNILSLLDMKTVGRTSILAKRWRYLGCQMVVLDFDQTELLYDLCNNPHKQSLHLSDTYRNWVNQVVALHSAPNIATFKVHFPLTNLYADDINNWIVFALSKNVAHLEINLSSYLPCPRYPSYILPFFRIPSLSRLYCSRFQDPSLHTSTSYTDTLRSLYLESLQIDGPLLQCVLSNCCNLERLTVKLCKTLHASSKLVVSSTALKYLDLSNCYSIEAVDICAPKLVSLVLFTGVITVEYQCVPSLVEVTFGWSYASHVIQNMQLLSPFASQLQTLSLARNRLLSYASTPLCPAFPNLKLLELGVIPSRTDNLLALASFLNAFPRLDKLKLKLLPVCGLPVKSMPVSKKAMIKAMREHQHLKIVEFVGLFDQASFVELALCLTEHLLMLKLIIFDPHIPRLMGKQLRLGKGCVERLETAKRKAERLAEQIKQGVDVVIL